MNTETYLTEGQLFIERLDADKVDNRILFKDRLITLSEATGKEIGELIISIDHATYSGKECYLVQASSSGIVDSIPVGTNITAYITPRLQTLEHSQNEFVNIPGKALNKKTILTWEDDIYQLTQTTTEGDDDETTNSSLTNADTTSLISEGANLVLQRLGIVHGMETKICFTTLNCENRITTVAYSPLETRSISIQDVTMETIGIERTIDGEQSPTVWNTYFLPDGHMYTRKQMDSPVYMKIRELPENFCKEEDEEWIFPDFGKGKLHWEDDLEMLSHFLDRKEELKDDHVNYMRRHPELKAILGDFLQFLLMRKPADVIEFAADFFSSYSANTEMKPSFVHSNCVNKSAIRSE